MKFIYPAIAKETFEGYELRFPDFSDCVAKGKNFIKAYENGVLMLKHALKSCIETDGTIPKPSAINFNAVNNSNESLVVISIDFSDDNDEQKEITTQIPKWLLSAAEKEGINIYKEIENTLIEKTGYGSVFSKKYIKDDEINICPNCKAKFCTNLSVSKKIKSENKTWNFEHLCDACFARAENEINNIFNSFVLVPYLREVPKDKLEHFKYMMTKSLK